MPTQQRQAKQGLILEQNHRRQRQQIHTSAQNVATQLVNNSRSLRAENNFREQVRLSTLRASANYRDGSQVRNAYDEARRGEVLLPQAKEALEHAEVMANSAAQKEVEKRRQQVEFQRLKQQHFKPNKTTATGVQFNTLVDEQGRPVNTTGIIAGGAANIPNVQKTHKGGISFNEAPKGLTAQKAELNEDQNTLNDLFGSEVFNRTDLAYPYSSEKGELVPHNNIEQMIGVAEWLLNGRTKTTWSPLEKGLIRERILKGDFTQAEQRALGIANQLNGILRRNEEFESTRNDARAFAEGLEVLIRANTHSGLVDEAQLIEDMKLYMIDQRRNWVGVPARIVHGIGSSNAAFNLFGGPRIGTKGWKEAYWDNGEQYDADGKPINQAHHFAAFFIAGLHYGKDIARGEARALDDRISITGYNPQDLALSRIAIELADKVRRGQITWEQLPGEAYRTLKR